MAEMLETLVNRTQTFAGQTQAFLQTLSPIELIATVFVTSSLAAAILFVWCISASCPKFRNGPKWKFFWGSTLEFMNNFDRIDDWLYDGTKNYGKFKRAWGASFISAGQFKNGMLCLVTPEEVKHVLKDNFENYVKGDLVHDNYREFFGDGIFAVDGQMWKFHRKVAANMFSTKLLIEGTEVAIDQAKKMMSLLEQKATRGEAVDLQPAFYAFTMDTFCSIAFGIELNSQVTPHAFAKAFDIAQELSTRRFQNPFWKLARLFNASSEVELRKQIGIIDGFAKRVIEARRRTLNDKSSNLGVDLVTRFLQRAKRNNEEIDTKELRDIVLNFIIAGRDTTAAALTWAIYELSRAPEAVAVIRKEVAAFVPAGTSILDLPKAEVFSILSHQMVETKSVVLEVLRLHPSVSLDVKTTIKADTLPTGVRVPAGCGIIYAPYSMGRNPELWKDPLKFDHTRFMQLAAKGDDSGPKSPRRLSVYRPTPVSDYKYPVFNAGPRLCLGRPLAMLEIQLILCSLLQRFDLEPVKPFPVPPNRKVTIVSTSLDGISVKLTPRNL